MYTMCTHVYTCVHMCTHVYTVCTHVFVYTCVVYTVCTQTHVYSCVQGTTLFRTFYEATGEWPDFSKPLEKSHRDAMYEKSPLIHVDKIITPYLLLIGEKDLRVVPHYKGFIRALQARGVPCKVHTYPESAHPLEEVDVEADFAINMLRWFEKYTQKNETKEE